MDRDELRSFVVEAHANGYADDGADTVADGTKRIEYEQGDWRYLDTYAGSRDFLGAEYVFHTGVPVWGMNYYGYLEDDAVDADTVYGFLQEALSHVSENHPLRGPDLERDHLAYENRRSGGIDRFAGEDSIAVDGDTVYTGFYRGGIVE